MRIVQPFARIVHFMGLPAEGRELLDAGLLSSVRRFGTEAVQFIEETGRICYRSEDGVTDTSYERFLQAHVLEARHTSMLRLSYVVVDFYVDRGVAQEILRHLFTLRGQMESQRYCNYSKGKFGEHVKFISPRDLTPEQHEGWVRGKIEAEANYFRQLKLGVKAQIAADELPRATACLVRLGGDFQAWRHFLLTRTTDACHPKLLDVTARPHLREIGEDAQLAMPSLLVQFQTVFPVLFDDIVPFRKHIDNMMMAR